MPPATKKEFSFAGLHLFDHFARQEADVWCTLFDHLPNLHLFHKLLAVRGFGMGRPVVLLIVGPCGKCEKLVGASIIAETHIVRISHTAKRYLGSVRCGCKFFRCEHASVVVLIVKTARYGPKAEWPRTLC